MKKNTYDYNKKYIPYAQDLRRNMTETEKKLWYDFLTLLPITAHRQKNIGDYIVDFYIPKAKTVIEIDGIQHLDPEEHDKDRDRDFYLRSQGMSVLRFDTVRVKTDFDGVKKEILRHIGLDREETYAFIENRRKEKEEERKNRFYKGK